VFCSKCGTNLPDGSEFCLKCGQAVQVMAGVASAVALFCSKCSTELPDESQFCLKCGQPVAIPGVGAAVAVAGNCAAAAAAPAPVPMPKLVRRRSKPKTAIWLIVLMLPAIAWVVLSNNSAAQELREFIIMSHTETIIEDTFPVRPRSFSSFKFTVPPGAIHVSVNGQFSTSRGSNNENNMEAFLVTDEAFAAWQSGYSTDTFYESGKASQGEINAALPSGGGAYYLLFKNNSSLRTGNEVHAGVSLHYNRWFPEWLLRLREQLWRGVQPLA
jgi:ribosomal protein L40E